MDVALEQSLAAAVRYIQDHVVEGTALYFDEIPENFFVPSVYFPVPRTTSKKVTLDTYLTTIYMEAWFMASTDWMAQEAAASIRDAILLDGCKIKSVNEEGLFSQKGFRVKEPEIKFADTGVVKMLLSLQNYVSKEQELQPSVNNISVPGLVSPQPSGIYSAWYAATGEQRKEEEVKKECLQKATKNL